MQSYALWLVPSAQRRAHHNMLAAILARQRLQQFDDRRHQRHTMLADWTSSALAAAVHVAGGEIDFDPRQCWTISQT
jgi:hypothetical protein